MNKPYPASETFDSDLYALLVDMVGEAVILHAQGRILLANQAAALLLGAESAEALAGLAASTFLPPARDDSLVARQVTAYPRRRSVTQTIRRSDGDTIDVMLAERPCVYLGQSATQVVIRSGGPGPRAIAGPDPTAEADLLTELPNRRQFCIHLQAAIDRAVRNRHQVWVLYVDMDHFRSVNSDHGHVIGDQVLFEAAARLRQCIRKTDMLASPGGDEFLIALEGTTDREGAAVVASRALQSLAQPFELGGSRIQISACIGICAAPGDSDVPEVLLQHADVAMWQAKSGSRGRSEFFSPAMDAQLRRTTIVRAQIEQRLLSLTPRESEVLDHLIAGEANKMIAYELGSSMRTIEHHRARIMEKMQAGSLPELVRMVLGRRDGG